jgi:hypothetical protein
MDIQVIKNLKKFKFFVEIYLKKGSLCEIINPCIPSPCKNNGICEQFGSLGYVCLCNNGFSGYNCSVSNSNLKT